MYLFYWETLKRTENKKVKAQSGFGFVWVNFVLLFMVVFFAITKYFDVLYSTYDFFLNILGRAETHKGRINVAFALFISIISAFSTYVLCCFRITSKEAVLKLEETSFFSSPSYWKIYAPLTITMVIFGLQLNN